MLKNKNQPVQRRKLYEKARESTDLEQTRVQERLSVDHENLHVADILLIIINLVIIIHRLVSALHVIIIIRSL